MIVLENVCGTLTSHSGTDFTAICQALSKGGYRFGALIVDAVLFVPQSRPRLFIIALRRDVDIPETLTGDGPDGGFHPRRLRTAYRKLPKALHDDWIWWRLDPPPPRDIGFADLVEDEPSGVAWHTPEETRALLAMMSDLNLKKVRAAERENRRVVGTIYKRTRRDEVGRKVQRAEVRFDDIAGCLRTPAGGSSRQLVLVVHGRSKRSRLISSRETARLVGLPDEYVLPDNYNEAYHLTGDGVVVPVVRFLAAKLFEPILLHTTREARCRMSIIPCQRSNRLREQIVEFADTLKTQAHTLGGHDLDEQEFYDSGLFRGTIERLRGQFAASMREKRELVQHVLNYMEDRQFIVNWEPAGDANRHDYRVQLPSGGNGHHRAEGLPGWQQYQHLRAPPARP